MRSAMARVMEGAVGKFMSATHGDGVEALRRRVRRHAARAKRVDRDGIDAVSFHD